ncbi:MANS1 protein, partial [Rhinopomastus cyanomelas]|nr:MANS1 protein [Rhinopomastus cyanomelas]
LALACAVARPCRGQQCSAERVGSAVINIDLSLPRGARVAEPRYAPTPQSCVRACCSGEEPSGDKPCNLVIFDAQRTSEYPNCYLFHCPSTEACPMTPVTGVVSYKITRDTRAPEDTAVQSEDLPSTAGALVSHSPSSHQSHATAFQQSVFHQASEFPPHVGKHLDSSEFHPVFPESQRVERPESADSIPRQQVMNLPPNKSSAVQTGNPSALFPTTQSSAPELSSTAPKGTTLLGSHATSLPGGAANPATASSATTAAFAPPAATRANPGIPTTSTAVTHLPLSALTASASTFTIKQVATDSRSAAAQSGTRTPASPPEPTVVSSNSTSATSLSVSGFALSTRASPMAFPKNPQGYDPSDSAIYPPESALGGKDAVQPGEKSLEAALCFGVLLLVLVIALKGRTLHECLQKRHYTRLDYLINGMYTDV